MKKLFIRSLLSVFVVAAACSTEAGFENLTGPDHDSFTLQMAGGWSGGCRVGDTLVPVGPGNPYDENQDLSVCFTGTDYYDNRIPNEANGGGWQDGCRVGDTLMLIGPGDFVDVDKNQDYAICSSGTRYYDNKLEGPKGGDGGGWEGGCRVGDSLILIGPGDFVEVDKNQDYAICSGSRGYYDNRI